ncbi:MAG: hypothetical protein PHI44_03015, partial [Candidatus Ratteibacteria bacterium]|nr:hypothetical protein [Candidatus Ratteibacteria bacterium]
LTEVEPAYIVGNFGVELIDHYRGKIVREQKTLSGDSIVRQGYPFYSGRMVYKSFFTFTGKKEKVFVRLVKASGILFKIRVNGKEAGDILWSPHILEITPLVKKGKNTISVELVSSLQNSWGPLHEREGDDNMWCGPAAFEDEMTVREELSLFNYGLAGIELICL